MTQFRMMTILLFVVLSLCCNVAPSGLKCLYSPCVNSKECKSGCCYRDSPNKPGMCAPDSYAACFGPEDKNLCFSSKECDNGCCSREDNPWGVAECGPIGKNHICLGPTSSGLYSHCPCDTGLRCAKNQNGNLICKKPKHGK